VDYIRLRDFKDEPVTGTGRIVMEKPGKILIGKDMDERYIRRIKERFPWIEVDTCVTEEEQDEKLRDADVLFTRIIPKDPSRSSRLKWVQFMWEGVDGLTPEFIRSDILLTNASGAHAVPIAEHVFAYMLNHERRTFLYHDYQKRKEWLHWRDQPKLGSLYGKTIGIIGYGRIGRAIAGIAQGFGMNVIAMKRDPVSKERTELQFGVCCDESGEIPSKIFGPEGLHQLLSRSDHVVLSLPLTKETEQIMGMEEFRSMKKGAYFINIGRGALVDEKALMKALDEEWISGAGLDVFEKEPLPPEHPLWSYDNVAITPHSSVGGDPADDHVVGLFMENLERLMDGRPLINLIDKERGY
jgi:phosphoglycerate dehydrogenase-like enzyme